MMNWKQNFNWKTWVPLAVAVVLGLVAAVVAFDITNKPRAAAQAADPMVDLVVAARDVNAGEALTSADLSTMKIAAPQSDAKKGETEPAAPVVGFPSAGMLVGRVMRAPAFAGQPIVEAQLAPLGAGSGLQAVLPAGMRAVTVEIDEYRGVAGFLVPGCHVDVVTTVQGKGDSDTLAKTVAQDIEVLAVGRTIGRAYPSAGPANGPAGSPGGPEMEAKPEVSKSVTLRATPEQAEALELAARLGLPRLVLRANGDRASTDNAGVSLAMLRGESTGPAGRATTPTMLAMSKSARPAHAAANAAASTAAAAPEGRPVQFIRRGVVTVEYADGPSRPATRPMEPAITATPQPDEHRVPTLITDLPTDLAFPN